MDDARIFGSMIRVLRERRQLSQAELGAACTPPRSQPAIAQWEAGARPLGEDLLAVATAALGIPSLREFLREGIRALDLEDRRLRAVADALAEDPESAEPRGGST
jgi:transcriptional regulator with XRE-family HTH domain